MAYAAFFHHPSPYFCLEHGHNSGGRSAICDFCEVKNICYFYSHQKTKGAWVSNDINGKYQGLSCLYSEFCYTRETKSLSCLSYGFHTFVTGNQCFQNSHTNSWTLDSWFNLFPWKTPIIFKTLDHSGLLESFWWQGTNNLKSGHLNVNSNKLNSAKTYPPCDLQPLSLLFDSYRENSFSMLNMTFPSYTGCSMHR